MLVYHEENNLEFILGSIKCPVGSLVLQRHTNKIGVVLEKKVANSKFFFHIFWNTNLDHDRNTA